MITNITFAKTFHFYVFRHVAGHVIVMMIVTVLLSGLIDLAEIFKQVSKRDVPIGNVFLLTMLRQPSNIPILLPFSVLFGALISFVKLSNTNEIMVARSNGFSFIKITSIGPIVFVLLLSLFMLLVADPFLAAVNKRNALTNEKIFGSGSANLTVSTEGIWLRDSNDPISMIINGSALERETIEVINAQVLIFDRNNRWLARYNPDRLTLSDGFWTIEGGTVIRQDGTVSDFDRAHLSSFLSEDDLKNTHEAPRNIPLLGLWKYIKVLDKAGLSSLKYRTYFYHQLSTPLVLTGMILIAGYFGLIYRARQRYISMVIYVLGCILLFHFAKEFMHIFGNFGKLSPIVAGFAPAVIVICLGSIMLIRGDNLH